MGDNAGAISDFDRAIALDPENAGAYLSRSVAKKEMGDAKGAEADMKKAKKLDSKWNL